MEWRYWNTRVVGGTQSENPGMDDIFVLVDALIHFLVILILTHFAALRSEACVHMMIHLICRYLRQRMKHHCILA